MDPYSFGIISGYMATSGQAQSPQHQIPVLRKDRRGYDLLK